MPSKGFERVQAQRIATDGSCAVPVHETVGVVGEDRLTIDVDGVDSYTLLYTPGDERALAVGFMRSEGLIESLDDLAELRPCEDRPKVMRARLSGPAPPAIDDPGRNLLIVSSCGACGSENLDERIRSLPAVGRSFSIDGADLRAASEAMRERQSLFDACGGSHGAAVFDERGRVLAVAEDAGRHNALDKAIGKCLLEGISTPGLAAALSGRVSLEMVGKCARAGLELMTAVSAPTNLAVEVAETCGITLCGFVRATRATLFTHPERVRLGGGEGRGAGSG